MGVWLLDFLILFDEEVHVVLDLLKFQMSKVRIRLLEVAHVFVLKSLNFDLELRDLDFTLMDLLVKVVDLVSQWLLLVVDM